MTQARVTQGHKVAIASGGFVPSKVTQGHKIVILTVGQVPSRVTQGHKVFIVQAAGSGPRPASGAIHKGSKPTIKIFKGTVPISRVYAGSALTFLGPSLG